jgi:hypothetical protein
MKRRSSSSFKTTAANRARILVYEFLTGKGPQQRTFEETHTLARDIRDGNIGRTIGQEIARRYAAAAARSSTVVVAPAGDVGLAPLDFGSFAVSVGFGLDRFLATGGDVFDPDADPIEAILGSYDYKVDTSASRVGKLGIEYAVSLTNNMSLHSLFAHGPTLRNFPRQSDLEKAIAEEEKTLPYSTTSQTIKFYIPLARP